MTFDEMLDQVRELLQRRNRVTYRSLKLRYQLDDEALAGVTDELIKAERVAVDEDGEVLAWTGASPVPSSSQPRTVVSSQLPVASPQHPAPSPQSPAERRQLTVMFCDLVGSTALSAQLDPEELRDVIRDYQETCSEVIRRYDGHIAQHLGDGLLVYFGYPAAHEDDAARAVRAGLAVVEKIHTLRAPSPALAGEGWGEGRLQVRIGIHTSRRGRNYAAAPRAGCPPSYGGRDITALSSCTPGRGVWERRTDRRGA